MQNCLIKKLINAQNRNYGRKKKNNGELWIYDKDINNIIKEFVKI